MDQLSPLRLHSRWRRSLFACYGAAAATTFKRPIKWNDLRVEELFTLFLYAPLFCWDRCVMLSLSDRRNEDLMFTIHSKVPFRDGWWMEDVKGRVIMGKFMEEIVARGFSAGLFVVNDRKMRTITSVGGDIVVVTWSGTQNGTYVCNIIEKVKVFQKCLFYHRYMCCVQYKNGKQSKVCIIK